MASILLPVKKTGTVRFAVDIHYVIAEIFYVVKVVPTKSGILRTKECCSVPCNALLTYPSDTSVASGSGRSGTDIDVDV